LERLKSFRWRTSGSSSRSFFGSRLSGRVFKGGWDIAVWLDDLGRAAELQYALAAYCERSTLSQGAEEGSCDVARSQ